MANFTEAAIKETFIKLLNEKPLNKITVKDIVESCGINRNSFYYHYEDIPTLLLSIINENTEKVINKYTTIDSIEQAMDVSLSFVLDHKRTVEHIYNSVSRDILETNLMRISEHVVRTCFDNLLSEYEINEEEKELIIKFYKCECFGFVIDAINQGLSDDTKTECLKFYELHKSVADSMLEKLPKKK